MKPDASIDYYAALGLQANASDDDIKKAFRKQALIHHPDRNPGKEDEAKSRFQDMQAAYDILNDPVKKQRYDNERIKKGMLWQKRTTSTAQPAAAAQNPFRQSQPPPRPPGPSAGASRYSAYTQSSRDSSPFHEADVNAKFQAWKAFENMKGTHKPAAAPKPSPSRAKPAPTAQKTRARSDWDEAQPTEPPRMSRSQSTRAPRKNGFNPYAEDGDDTSSRHTSAYYNVNRGERPKASYPRPAENIFTQPGPAKAPGKQTQGYSASSEDLYTGDRQSTPYASMSGEKTYFPANSAFGRSASASTNLNNLGKERPPAPSGLDSDRRRSASPKAQSSHGPQSADEPSSDSSAFETMADRIKTSQQEFYTRRGSADPRTTAPKATTEDDSDGPRRYFPQPKRQTTWDSEHFTCTDQPKTHYSHGSTRVKPETIPEAENSAQRFPRPNLQRDQTVPSSTPGHNTPFFAAFAPPRTDRPPANDNRENTNGFKPSLYGHASFPFARRFRVTQPKYAAACEETAGTGVYTSSWPYWAVPSSVGPVKSTSRDRLPTPFDILSCSQARRDVLDANVPCEYSSFSIPHSPASSGLASKNTSSENVNAQFSPTDMPHTFQGATDYMESQPRPATRNSRNRGSPPKRPVPFRVPASTSDSSGATSHTATPGAAVRDSEVNNTTTSETLNRSSTNFSSEEWNKEFQTRPPMWTMFPPPVPSSNRPISTPRSKNSKRTGQSPHKGNGASKTPYVESDDTGDEDDDEGRQSRSRLNTSPGLNRTPSTSAMDVDSNTPPATRVATNGSSGPTPLSANTTSPPPTGTTFPKPPPPATAFNMQPLGAAFPVSGSSSGGLSGMKSDFGSTLPFESASSPRINTPPRPQKLDLPPPPKPPLPPGRLTQNSYSSYMNQVATYVREFHDFNRRMLAHFQARQAMMDSMMQSTTDSAEKGFLLMINGVGGGVFGSSGIGGVAGASLAATAGWSWMGARGDEGYLKYLSWMDEDVQVRAHHEVAWNRHREALEKLGDVRREMSELVRTGRLT